MNIASLKSRSRRTSVALLGAVALGAAVVPAANASTATKLPVQTSKTVVTIPVPVPVPPPRVTIKFPPIVLGILEAGGYHYGRSGPLL